MKDRYKLPIQGKVLNDKPLTGDARDPIEPINLQELPNCPTYFNEELGATVKQGYGIRCGEYDVDEEWCEVELEASEEFHGWLAGILPQLSDIKRAGGWTLDKTELEKARLAREGA